MLCIFCSFNDQKVALSLWWIGMTFKEQSRYNDALNNLNEAKQIYSSIFGNDHDDTKSIQHSIDEIMKNTS